MSSQRPLVRVPRAALLAGALLSCSAVTTCAAAAPPARAPVVGADGWRPPVRPVHVTRTFDPPARAWLAGHRGVDLRARAGLDVRAAGAGRVSFAGVLAGRGVLVIDHGVLRTTYEPVDAEVRVGQRVRAGEVVGRVGTGTGHCGDGTCLHLGLRRGSTYLDPRLVLDRGRAVLRPW